MDGLGRSTFARFASGTVAVVLGLSLAPPAAQGAGAAPAAAVRHRVTMNDQVREPGSAHVDVVRATLNNGRNRLAVSLRFRSLRVLSLNQIGVGIDVDQASRGFLLHLTPSRRSLRGTLSTAVLFSDGSTAHRVPCRGLRVTVRARHTVHASIPRGCLRIGGDRARFHWFASDRHGHYDESPWNGSGFSPWTKRAR